ncbi:protealysin inhibitor emfourin [Kouleothrix sp.]|uniref:protealysin inhibitor emfourin n=1 Tax=Kouleothrix sp. TaxID=2779161 RepID=UPI00391C5F4B
MRVQLSSDGGLAYFPGLRRSQVVDTADLSDEAAAALRRLVAEAGLFQRPASRPALPKGAADARQYTLTVEDGRRRRAIRLADPIDDARLAALVEFVRAHAAPGAGGV